MFGKVLYVTDFSEYAQKITECLGEIPGINEIIILHVIDTKRTAYGEENESVLIKKAELMLKEQKERLGALGKSMETAVKVGIPSKEILSTAEQEKVSLVVMGARGRSLIKDILLGSVSSDILRYGRTNMLIMRHRIVKELEGEVFEKYCDRIFSKVLYPTDFSGSAEQTLSLIKQIPNMGRIILVHVVDKGETKEELDTYVEEAEGKLKNLQEYLTGSGIDSDYHVHIGDPVNEINRVAEEEDVSLIAISSRGKGLIDEIRLGSAAENVVRNAKRPVMILKMKKSWRKMSEF